MLKYYLPLNLLFSEQQVVSCATDAGYGCEGGWPDAVYDYYMDASVGGAVPTSAWPYASGNVFYIPACRITLH